MPNDQHSHAATALDGVKIMALPGRDLPPGVVGKTGHELVSTSALNRLIEAHQQALGLLPDTDEATSRAYFRVLLSAGDPIARQIAERLGRNLGYLILTLRRADEINRAAYPQWHAADWKRWQRVEQVYLAGGLLSGTTGMLIAQAAQAITRPEMPHLRLTIADHPTYLALIGAARYVTTELSTHVFDFGSTYVKRARVMYGSYGLERVHILDRIGTNIGLTADRDDAQHIFNRMVVTIAETCDENTTGIIPISLSAMVDEHGQLTATDYSIYSHLLHLTDDVGGMLADAISRQTGRPLTVRLLHAGTAAATTYANKPKSAVLMLGAHVGAGFPVPHAKLRPIAPNLSVTGGRGDHTLGFG